jgi:TolB-like protein/Tfp pilus assembly protein PilF
VAYGAGTALALAALLVALNVGGWRARLLGRAASPRIESLAVLPLANLSGDASQEYFADGMTEALITDLSRIRALRVISRTSVMRYKGTTKPVPEIARELNVEAVVEGSVQWSGDRVRVTAQLIGAPTDTHLWAESYDRDLRDVLALQDDVARAIASQIKVKLTPQEQVRLASAHRANPEAHEAYLKGRYYWNKRSRGEVKKSLEYFQRAIEIDPTYPLAYAGIADAYSVLGDKADVAPSEAWPKARAASLKALEIDETLGEAHASLALVKLNYDLDWVGAEREFKRAIELSSNYASAHQWYGIYLSAMGRSEEAISEEKRAHELDPLSLIMYRAAGTVFHNAHRYDEEIEVYRKALEMDPNFQPVLDGLVQAHEEQGMIEEAIAEFRQLRTLTGDWPPLTARLASIYARAGRRGEALKLLDELKAQSPRRYVSASNIAMVYTALGDKGQAIAWLERAYVERSPHLYLLKVRPWMDPLRDDPRFQDLVRRVGLPP